MKKLQNAPFVLARMAALFTMTLLATIAWGQDKGVDIDVDLNKHSDNWYANPILWIIGGAVFILLLVALLRGGSKDAA
jgi:hypothetical protein